MFLQDSQEWKQAYFDLSKTTRLVRAKKIYQTYITQNANFQINIGHALYLKLSKAFVWEQVESDDQDVEIEVFDEARKEIKRLLKEGPLVRFRKTHEYRTFIEHSDRVQNLSQRALNLIPVHEDFEHTFDSVDTGSSSQ